MRSYSGEGKVWRLAEDTSSMPEKCTVGSSDKTLRPGALRRGLPQRFGGAAWTSGRLDGLGERVLLCGMAELGLEVSSWAAAPSQRSARMGTVSVPASAANSDGVRMPDESWERICVVGPTGSGMTMKSKPPLL